MEKNKEEISSVIKILNFLFEKQKALALWEEQAALHNNEGLFVVQKGQDEERKDAYPRKSCFPV